MYQARIGFVPLAIALVTLLFATACRDNGAAVDKQLTFGEPLDPIIEAVPKTPTVADEGKPGVFAALSGVEPIGRVYRVDPTTTPTAGVLLVHGKWGLDEFFRDTARALAERGLVVVSPDLYEGLIPTAYIALEELQAGVGESRAIALIRAGLDELRADERLKGKRLMILGMGAGGPYGYAAAKQEPDLAALVLDTSRLPESISWLRGVSCPVAMLIGAEDNRLSDFVHDNYVKALKEAGVEFTPIEIPRAATDLLDPHAMGYNPSTRGQAIDRVIAFLEQ